MSVTKRIDRDEDGFDPYVDLTITANYIEHPAFSSSIDVSIIIDDINDNLPEFNLETYDYYVDENFSGRLYADFDIQVSDPDLVCRVNSHFTLFPITFNFYTESRWNI